MLSKITLLLIASLMLFSCTKGSNSGPPKENVFRYGIEAKMGSLDPHQSDNVYALMTEALFYEPLFQMHYLKRPYEITPLLAAELPKLSADGKTATIKIKKGIFFHDDPCFKDGKGREVKIDDVIYMFERIAGKTINSSVYSGYQGNLVGVEAFHDGKAKTISGLKKIDDYTLEIKLTKVLPRFIYTLSLSDTRASIMPREAVEKYGDELARHPVGTGPFLPKEVNLSSKIIAVKNLNYNTVTYPTEGNAGDAEKGLLADAGKKLPLLDKIVLEVITESQPRWLKFMSGEFELTAIPKDNMATALPGNKLSPELAAKGIQHFRAAKGDVTVQIFNMMDPVWGKSKDLRHAVALALDVEKMIQLQYSGQAIRAESTVDPVSYGYDVNFKSKWSKRDVAKAKELLAKAGYPDGKGLPPLKMPTMADSTARQLDEMMTRQLAEVGIVLQSEAMTWPEFERRGREHNFGMIGLGYSSSVPDFDDGTTIYSSKYIPTGSNMAAYSNPKADKLIGEIEEMKDGPARMKKITEFKELVDDELPVISMVHRIGNQLVQPWVKNHVYLDSSFIGQFLKYHRTEAAK